MIRYSILCSLLVNLAFVAPAKAVLQGDEISATSSIARSTVWIFSAENPRQYCSGTLLDGHFVLTAAHCLSDITGLLKVGFAVKASLVNADNTLPVTASLMNSGFHTNDNDPSAPIDQTDYDEEDLALLHLSGTIPQGYQSASLLTDSSAIQPGDRLWVAGYGIFVPVQVGQEPKIREKSLAVKALWGKTEIELAQDNGIGACFGDSGGPVFVEQDGHASVLGVISRGDHACYKYSIITRLDSYFGWIRESETLLDSGRWEEPIRR